MVRKSVLIAAMLAAGPAAAQEAPAAPEPIRVELNRLEAAGADCRATLVVENGATPLESLKLDLVIFDGEGIVARRLAAELAPLSASKTVVKTFPVTGLGCDDVSRVLVNDVMTCTAAAGPEAGCIDRLETASRTPARFTK